MFNICLIFSIQIVFILGNKNGINYQIDINHYNENKINLNFRHLNDNSNNPDKKNVIIGLIKGYTWSIVKPFFISLITANIKNCDLVMFVEKIPEETLNKIKLCGAIIKEMPMKELGFQDLVKYRWKIFGDFIKENKDKYGLVFIADVRDVIFQKDIFQFYDNTKSFIGFTFEDITLRNQVNKNWVKYFCKNNKEYNTIADERVICGGTIIASVDKFIEFIDILWEAIANLTNFFDQGAINYLIHYKKILNDSIIFSDNNGPIMTICVTKRNKIILDNDDNVLNFQGKIAAIVHQYDRKPDIIRKMNRKYSDDILNKYYNINKIEEDKRVNEEYLAQKKYKNRIKIIRKTILIIILIISIILIIYIRAKRSGLIKTSKKRLKHKDIKIKKKFKKKKNYINVLSTSDNKII